MIGAGAGIDEVTQTFQQSLKESDRFEQPYRRWHLRNVLPKEAAKTLTGLTFPLQNLDGVSGKREFHNDSRHYFDQENIARFEAASSIAHAFQSDHLTSIIEAFFEIDLSKTYLRIEYAQDIDGFWLEPHTDLGVKKLTALIYLSDDSDQSDLGTDYYDADKSWAGRAPFEPNTAMAFVPGDDTYHGFERRKINGVRRSLILNYVTAEWRDREQLAFPHQPIGG